MVAQREHTHIYMYVYIPLGACRWATQGGCSVPSNHPSTMEDKTKSWVSRKTEQLSSRLIISSLLAAQRRIITQCNCHNSHSMDSLAEKTKNKSCITTQGKSRNPHTYVTILQGIASVFRSYITGDDSSKDYTTHDLLFRVTLFSVNGLAEKMVRRVSFRD